MAAQVRHSTIVAVVAVDDNNALLVGPRRPRQPTRRRRPLQCPPSQLIASPTSAMHAITAPAQADRMANPSPFIRAYHPEQLRNAAKVFIDESMATEHRDFAGKIIHDCMKQIYLAVQRNVTSTDFEELRYAMNQILDFQLLHTLLKFRERFRCSMNQDGGGTIDNNGRNNHPNNLGYCTWIDHYFTWLTQVHFGNVTSLLEPCTEVVTQLQTRSEAVKENYNDDMKGIAGDTSSDEEDGIVIELGESSEIHFSPSNSEQGHREILLLTRETMENGVDIQPSENEDEVASDKMKSKQARTDANDMEVLKGRMASHEEDMGDSTLIAFMISLPGNYDDLLEKMKSFVTPESERRGIVFLLAASSVGQTPGSPTSDLVNNMLEALQQAITHFVSTSRSINCMLNAKELEEQKSIYSVARREEWSALMSLFGMCDTVISPLGLSINRPHTTWKLLRLGEMMAEVSPIMSGWWIEHFASAAPWLWQSAGQSPWVLNLSLGAIRKKATAASKQRGPSFYEDWRAAILSRPLEAAAMHQAALSHVFITEQFTFVPLLIISNMISLQAGLHDDEAYNQHILDFSKQLAEGFQSIIMRGLHHRDECLTQIVRWFTMIPESLTTSTWQDGEARFEGVYKVVLKLIETSQPEAHFDYHRCRSTFKLCMQLLIVLRGSLPDHSSDIKVLLNVICPSNPRDPSLFDALTADTQERAELYLILLQIVATRKDLETCAMMPVVLSSMSMWLTQEGSPVLTGDIVTDFRIYDQLKALILRHSHLAGKTLCPLSNLIIATQLYGSLVTSVRRLATLKSGIDKEETTVACLCIANSIMCWVRWQSEDSLSMIRRQANWSYLGRQLEAISSSLTPGPLLDVCKLIISEEPLPPLTKLSSRRVVTCGHSSSTLQLVIT